MNLLARSIILALISTTIISSGEPTPKTVRVITPDKLEKRHDVYYEANQTTPFTGLVQKTYPNGKKSEEMSYKDGKFHGVQTYWNKKGKKWNETNFKDGKLHGVTTWWDQNGNKREESNDGKEHGVETKWDINGQKSSEVNYKNGKKHGVETKWDMNGKKTETKYENGMRKN